MIAKRDQGRGSSGNLIDTPLGQEVRRTVARNALTLSQAPAAAGLGAKPREAVRRGVGALWNAPNDAIGQTYGYVGDAVGKVGHAFAPGHVKEPEVRHGRGQIEFVNNPFATGGAVTIGSNILYEDDPYSSDGRKHWKETERIEGHPVWEHERQHILQARQLGPFYLPSNLAGGINAKIHGEDWHGTHNWNERGPQMNPARPWAPWGSR